MMEVKQSATSMDFNDLISATTNSNSNSEDTAVMSTNLEATKLKADLLKANEITSNGLLPEVTNGSSENFTDADTAAETASIDLDGDLELDGSVVAPELEDELLADDNDAIVVDQLITTKTADSLIDDKAETTSSAANAIDKLHNPGDDLDILLSKINDIVEDCIDTAENVAEKTETQTENAQNKVISEKEVKKNDEEKEEVNAVDSVALVADKAEQKPSEKVDELKTAQTETQSIEESDVEMKAEVEAEPIEKDEAKETVDTEPAAVEDAFMDGEDEDYVSPSDQLILDVDLNAAQNAHDEKEIAKLVSVEDASSAELENKDTETATDTVAAEIVINEAEVVTQAEEQIEVAEELKTLDTKETTKIEIAPDSAETVAKVTELAEEPNSIEEKSTKEVVKEIPTLVLDDDDEEMPEETKPAEATNESNEVVSESAKEVSSSDAKPDGNNDNLEVDDSDDDVVFFVDKPDGEIVDKLEVDTEKSEETKLEEPKESTAKSEEITPATPTAQSDGENVNDDDVVLLDDDEDDDDAATATDKKTAAESEKKSTDATEATKVTEEKTDATKVATTANSDNAAESKKDTDLLEDNSDNARDDFAEAAAVAEKEKDIAEKLADAVEAEETNSNCSSSSNLLQEAKGADSVGPEEEEEETAVEEPELENEEEDEAEVEVEAEEGDVELVEELAVTPPAVLSGDETKDGDEANVAEEKETVAPPAKRIRLSVEDDEESKVTNVVGDEINIESNKESNAAETKEKTVQVDKPADDDSNMETIETPIATASAAMKRSHESLESKDEELLTEPIEQTATKKAKTEDNDKEKAVEELKEVEELVAADVPQLKKIATDTNEAASTAAVEDKKDIKPVVEAEAEEAETTDAKMPTPAISEDIPEAKSTEERKFEVRAVPSEIPIPLYPPPKFDTFTKSLSLDFYHRFRKSFVKLTKNDLEELALQKVVEAIVHKSEFAEMREIIEKQEKIIALHRTRISELSKQFRDLEMVHNRVLKDVEQKNSQFIMPVKITRAVGLQVFIPHKKNPEPLSTAIVSNSASPPVTAGAPSVPVVSQTAQLPMSTVRSSPQRANAALASPQRPAAVGSADVASSTNAVDVLSRRISNSALASAAASAALNTRRGCAQKITPQRPTLDATAAATSSNTVSSSTPSPAIPSSLHSQLPPSLISPHQQQPQSSGGGSNVQKALNKTIAVNAAAAAMQRNRFSGPTPSQKQHPAQLQQQQQQQTQQQQLARQQMQNLKFRKIAQKPSTGNSQSSGGISQQQQQQHLRRSDQMPQATILPATSSSMDSYMNSLNQLSPGVPAVSITPAKPKEKAVIDLTDEDDASHAPPPPPLHTRGGGPVQGNQSAAAVAASAYMSNRAAAAAVASGRMPNSQKPQMAVRQLSSMQAQKSNGNSSLSSISTPPGTSITRVHLSGSGANSAQRTKYGHPAPLPPAPPQTFNPAWKLPPPRPTIRISNLDNGIVISWTMEESMERHADCVSYQIYAYQETSGPPAVDSWRHVGDVKAMLLPMAVTLTQFQEGQRYYFAVRAVDVHQRFGQFSLPKTWS